MKQTMPNLMRWTVEEMCRMQRYGFVKIGTPVIKAESSDSVKKPDGAIRKVLDDEPTGRKRYNLLYR